MWNCIHAWYNLYVDILLLYGGIIMEQLRTLALFRCTEKQYAQSFCTTGNMKFNTPQYWIDLEKKEGKGRGDLMEGVCASSNMFDINTLLRCQTLRQNIYPETIKGITYFRSKDILNLPCYCLFGLNNTAFENEFFDRRGVKYHSSIVAKQYFQDFSNNSTDESAKVLSDDRKPVLIMIMNPSKFVERVINYFESIGVKREEILISPVEYMDKNIPFVSIKKFPYELFLKDKSFSYQSEIRIIINTKDRNVLKELADKNNIVNIGDLQDITHIEEFYYKDMAMAIRGNKLYYALPEPKEQDLKDLPVEELISTMYDIREGVIKVSSDEKKTTLQYLEELLKSKYGIYHIQWPEI